MTHGIAVAGAGLTGSLLATRLGRRGHSVTIYERRRDLGVHADDEARSINLALSTRGLDALDRVGLTDTVRARAVAMRSRVMHAVDGGLTRQPYGTDPAHHLLSVDRDQLGRLVLDVAAATSGVHVEFAARVTSADPDDAGVTVGIEHPDGADARCHDVLYGADGAFSGVRRHLVATGAVTEAVAGIGHGYKELTIPPAADGTHRFEPEALHIWPRGDHMLIALPNTDGSFTCTLFWPFQGPVGFEAVGAAEVADVFAELFADAADALGDGLAGQYASNPTSRLVTVAARPWHVGDRVLLVGDAAHAVVPFYGQGANAALEDVTILCDLLDADDRAAAFATFSRRRNDTDVLADLAMENFVEMRSAVRSRAFLLGAALRRVAHRIAPRYYLPLYTMVTFTRLPYAVARRRARLQDRVALGLLLAVVAVVAVLIGVIA